MINKNGLIKKTNRAIAIGEITNGLIERPGLNVPIAISPSYIKPRAHGTPYSQWPRNRAPAYHIYFLPDPLKTLVFIEIFGFLAKYKGPAGARNQRIWTVDLDPIRWLSPNRKGLNRKVSIACCCVTSPIAILRLNLGRPSP